MRQIIKKIESCRTITQLDLIRGEVFDAMKSSGSFEEFDMIQKAFRRQKIRIRRKVYGKENEE